jgi:hypothetical protein
MICSLEKLPGKLFVAPWLAVSGFRPRCDASSTTNRLIRVIRALLLTVWDLVRFARERGFVSGRGRRESAVLLLLGVTAVDPARIDLLFARFISRDATAAGY